MIDYKPLPLFIVLVNCFGQPAADIPLDEWENSSFPVLILDFILLYIWFDVYNLCMFCKCHVCAFSTTLLMLEYCRSQRKKLVPGRASDYPKFVVIYNITGLQCPLDIMWKEKNHQHMDGVHIQLCDLSTLTCGWMW